MASFRKRSGAWQALVARQGVRDSATFDTKAEAVLWAAKREAEIVAGARGEVVGKTLRDALTQYAKIESPRKKGERWELMRLAKFAATMPFADKLIANVQPADISGWRDVRRTQVSDASTRREMVLLRSVFEVARKEWGWLQINPMDDVRKPMSAPPRKRRVSVDEAQRLCLALGWMGGPAATVSDRVAVAFMFALETAMRSGEICAMRWQDVNLPGCYVTLPETKNGDRRDVPLSSEARRLLGLLPEDGAGGLVFDLAGPTRDALFRRARNKAELADLTFHDSRHEALTRLAKKLQVLDLARMSGHRDLKSLMIYYNETASEIAAKLG